MFNNSNDTDLMFGGDFFDLGMEADSTEEKLQLREGELREVAMLFADIKGFSSISNLFDAETIHKKMDELMKLFSRCISYYGGFVDKFMGDGIMALFGAKQASEQDTERAIMAALKMQQQLGAYNRMLKKQAGFENVELGLRIGINTGIVSVGKVGADREGDFTVYGPEVNLASRMESNAPVNKIMLPFATMKQVSRSFDFEAVGELSVKGFDQPIDCYTVLAPKLEGSLHHRNHSSGYVGRETELAKLNELLTAAKGNGSSLMHIRGDAGMGKTRLVYEYEKANSDKAMFLHGACSGISPAPLNLFSSVFEAYFRIQLNENPELKLSKLSESFTQLETDMDAASASKLKDITNLIAFLLEIKLEDTRLKQSGTDLLNHLFMAIETFMQCIAAQAARAGKPLLMILDDLHWLDEASNLVLQNLITKDNTANAAVVWVLMSRMEFELPDYCAGHPNLREIRLKPLTEDNVRALISAHTSGIELPETAINKVVSLSEGNPFYLEEWCSYIESLPQNELRDFPVPATLHSLIQSRLDRLPIALRTLLYKASVIGKDFFVDILKQIEARLGESINVDETLANLEEQSIVFKALGFDYSAYFFKHIATREVAYQTLLQENRKLLHRLCGEAIEQLYPNRLNEFYFVLADHFSKAEVWDKAASWLELAADKAASTYNNEQALELYRKLLGIPSVNEPKKLETRLKIADIMWLKGEWDSAAEDIELVLDLAKASNNLAICCHACRFLGMASIYMPDMQRAYQLFTKAEAIATELGDPLLTCIAKSNLSNWYLQNSDYEHAKALQLASLELALQLNEHQRQAKSLSNLGMIALNMEDTALALDYFGQSLKIATTQRLLKEESIALGNIGYTYIIMQDYANAMPMLQAKLELADKMNDFMEQVKALENICNILLEQENSRDALPMLARLHKLKLSSGNDAEASELAELMESLSGQGILPG